MKTRWERINREHGRRKSNYKSFDKALDLHFSYDTPTNKDDLSNKMTDYGFHVVDNDKESPTDKQLNHAWEYILKNYLPKQKEITDYYQVETTGISHTTRKPNYRYRATRNIIYKNKKYRKGQFMPKQEMLDID
jgi:hypothetical protein